MPPRRESTRGTEMSLRAFHLLFIALSVVLAVFFAAWAGGQYKIEHSVGYAVTAGAALVGAVGLAWYARLFQQKTRNL